MFPARSFLDSYFSEYVLDNPDARSIMRQIGECRFDARALVDHCTIRTLDIESVAKELYAIGFEKMHGEAVDMGDWFLQPFQKHGYPVIVVDQPREGRLFQSGGGEIIDNWVKTFGGERFHHIAIRVESIFGAVKVWREKGISFVGDIVCDKETGLKQIFTKAVAREGNPFTVLEFIERPPGCTGLVVPNANQLVLSVRY